MVTHDGHLLKIFNDPLLKETSLTYPVSGNVLSFDKDYIIYSKSRGDSLLLALITSDKVGKRLILMDFYNLSKEGGPQILFDVTTPCSRVISIFPEDSNAYMLCSDGLKLYIYNSKGEVLFKDIDNKTAFAKMGFKSTILCGYDGKTIGQYSLHSKSIEKIKSTELPFQGQPDYGKIAMSMYSLEENSLYTNSLYENGELFIYNYRSNRIVYKQKVNNMSGALASQFFTHNNGNLFVYCKGNTVCTTSLFGKPCDLFGVRYVAPINIYNQFQFLTGVYDRGRYRIYSVFMLKDSRLEMIEEAVVDDKPDFVVQYDSKLYLYYPEKIISINDDNSSITRSIYLDCR